MTLNYNPMNTEEKRNLFPHSKKFDEGTSLIRPGQATIVVALDGSGDCDTFQEAISRIGTAGGSIYIKDGTYKINEALSVSLANLSIIGSGKSTILDFNTPGATSFKINNADNVVISNISFEQTSGTILIELDSNNNVDINGLWIKGAGSIGLYINSTGTGFRVHNNIFEDCGAHGLSCEGPSEARFINNLFKGNSGSGIYGDAMSSCVISNNVIDDCGGDGIYLINSDYNIIGHNIFKTITDNAIEISSATSDKNLISSNMLIGETISDSGTGTIKVNNVS